MSLSANQNCGWMILVNQRADIKHQFKNSNTESNTDHSTVSEQIAKLGKIVYQWSKCFLCLAYIFKQMAMSAIKQAWLNKSTNVTYITPLSFYFYLPAWDLSYCVCAILHRKILLNWYCSTRCSLGRSNWTKSFLTELIFVAYGIPIEHSI